MPLITYRKDEPLRMLATLSEEVNRLFEGSPLSRLAGAREGMFTPSVDMWEDKDNIYVDAEMPGLEQKDINVTVEDSSLVISGRKEESKEEKGKNFYCCETFQGSFYRRLELPASVDAGHVKANYKSGILRMTLPKREEKKGTEIKVKVE